MTDESASFSTAKSRLEEIVTQVRKKDTSLEKSLDLLEEGVRLANACTELIDHADWTAGNAPASDTSEGGAVSPDGAVVSADADDAVAAGDALASAEPVAAAVEDIPDGAPLPDEDAEFAPDDDAFGDAAEEVWSDPTPDFADVESEDEPDTSA